MKRIAWRDSMMTWPGLSVKIEFTGTHIAQLAYRDSAEPALPPDISWMSPTGNEKDWMTI